MKIGIITFQRAANYGAVLQAYALQSYLKMLQNEVEIIDYRCRSIECVHSPFYFLYVKGIKNKIKQLLRFPIKLKKRRIFNYFLNQKLELSNAVDKETIKVLFSEKYDVIIAGSDQIWNLDITGGDTTYLLDFVSPKTFKVSYAASFGVNKLKSEQVEQYKKYIYEFNKLSVREQQGATIIKKLYAADPFVTVDPTLLLTHDEWENFMTKPKYDNYVLLYMIQYNENMINIARKLSAEKNIPLIFISDSILRKKRIKYIKNATPEEWVGLFHNASYVVTNSFHGTVFSIIFNRKFIVGLSHSMTNGNARIIDLLDNLNIEYNIVENVIDLSKNIDWEKINIEMEKLRKDSCQFLEFTKIRKEK